MTPAMEAKITQHVWTLEKIVCLVGDYADFTFLTNPSSLQGHFSKRRHVSLPNLSEEVLLTQGRDAHTCTCCLDMAAL